MLRAFVNSCFSAILGPPDSYASHHATNLLVHRKFFTRDSNRDRAIRAKFAMSDSNAN